ncbi:hypothetical protein [Vampirovibrio chlorellavorus]|uniref:hypothetical protein n=1 Tax=Vampirovibrio chlorellavorus TaxID=758823 RepID=UPI0026EF7437|nr:hypothetical protein [Vampirovibrio chlorellavorus]
MNAERHPEPTTAYQAMVACLASSPDVYVQLNALRDWVNAHYPDFELYLEDVWNERTDGETHFEYILRSRHTFNETELLGYDIYKNHRDAKGVWHLDEYVSSVRLIQDPQGLLDFIAANRRT